MPESNAGSTPREKTWRRVVRPLVIGAVLLGLFAAAREYLTPAGFEVLLDRVNRMGPWAPVMLTVIYMIACVLVLPASILTLAAGFLFGLWKGYLVVAVGSVLGASAAFWIGRTIGRDWVRRKVEGNRRFNAIDRAVAGSGFKIVVLTRLSPIFPFNLQNFVYGVTGVTFRDYFWATWIGMIPGTLMFVYFGSAMMSVAEVLSGKTAATETQQALKIAGLAATVAATVVVTRVATRALKDAVGNGNGQ